MSVKSKARPAPITWHFFCQASCGHQIESWTQGTKADRDRMRRYYEHRPCSRCANEGKEQGNDRCE